MKEQRQNRLTSTLARRREHWGKKAKTTLPPKHCRSLDQERKAISHSARPGKRRTKRESGQECQRTARACPAHAVPDELRDRYNLTCGLRGVTFVVDAEGDTADTAGRGV